MALSRSGRSLALVRALSPAPASSGVSLVELLVGLALALLLAMLALQGSSEPLARQAVEGVSRRIAQGLELGRADARRLAQPCGLQLATGGWLAPSDPGLPPCRRALLTLQEPLARQVQLAHNFPGPVRFSSRGLAIDGGTVVISAEGTPLRRCLVLALPLGVIRLGRYSGDPAQTPESAACKPDASL